jgi:hypothetical protein
MIMARASAALRNSSLDSRKGARDEKGGENKTRPNPKSKPNKHKTRLTGRHPDRHVF